MGWIIAWLVLTTIIVLNGFAAGVVAALFAWRLKLPRESRVFVASVTAALVPSISILVLLILGSTQTGDPFGAMGFLITFGACLAIGTVVALPGSILVARKLEAPGDDYRTFE